MLGALTPETAGNKQVVVMSYDPREILSPDIITAHIFA
jgi:hypothetical protein